MADEVKFIARVEDQATAVFRQIGEAAQNLGNKFAGLADTAKTGFGKAQAYIDNNRQGIQAIGVASGIAFGGMAALVVDSTNKFADFEKQMSSAKAVLGLFGKDEATKKTFKDLTDLALKLGADTKYSSEEAAQGITILGQAGFDAAQIMAVLPGVLNLAAASNLSIADSADIASSVLRQFNLQVEDTGRVMDVLNKTAIMSNADVLNLRDSFNYFGATAHVLGISLEESSAAIGILANNGIKGSAATRALGTALTRLAAPTKKMAAGIEEVGLKAFDANGNFVGLASIVEQLQKGTAKLTQEQKAAAVSAIFGAEAFGEVSILMESGADKIRSFTEELKNSGGTTAKMAATQMDNLKGSIELLSGSFQNLQTQVGGSIAPMFRSLVDALNPIVDKFGERVAKNPEFAAGLLLAATAAAGLVAALAGIALIAGSIAAGFAALGGGAAVAAFLGLAAAGVVLYDAILDIKNLFEERGTAFGNWLQSMVGPAGQFFTDLGTTITDGWQNIKNTRSTKQAEIVAATPGFFDQLSSDWNIWLVSWGLIISDGLTYIQSIRNGAMEWIKAVVTAGLDYVSTRFSKTWAAIKIKAAADWQGIKDIFTNAIQSIKDFFSGGGKALLEAGFNNMISGLAGIAKTVLNGVIGAFEGMINLAIAGVNKLIEAANKFSPVRINTVPNISLPRLANGGFVEGPSMKEIMSGFGHFAGGGVVSGPKGVDKVPAMLTDGELVLNQAQQSSLANFIKGGGQGSTIQVTVSGNNFYGDDTEFAQKIGDMIVSDLKKHTPFESF